MARRRTTGRPVLWAANALLLAAALALVWSAPSRAGAQGRTGTGAMPEGSPRARGEYTMVAGRLTAGGPAAVYIIDAANQEVIVLQWDQAMQGLKGIGYRDLALDARALRSR